MYGGGVVGTFSCSMYVEIIRCFHICSITINACDGDLVQVSVRKEAEESADSPGYVAFSEESEVLKTQPEEMENGKKYLG